MPTCHIADRLGNNSSHFLWTDMHPQANRSKQSILPNYQRTLRPSYWYTPPARVGKEPHVPGDVLMMMIAFITFKSSLVPLFEGLWSSNSWEFEVSGFRRNRTDDSSACQNLCPSYSSGNTLLANLQNNCPGSTSQTSSHDDKDLDNTHRKVSKTTWTIRQHSKCWAGAAHLDRSSRRSNVRNRRIHKFKEGTSCCVQVIHVWTIISLFCIRTENSYGISIFTFCKNTSGFSIDRESKNDLILKTTPTNVGMSVGPVFSFEMTCVAVLDKSQWHLWSPPEESQDFAHPTNNVDCLYYYKQWFSTLDWGSMRSNLIF